MKKLGLNEIREKYLSFFESKGHLRQHSYPLVPQNDKSLLLINAGMAPLKNYFTGLETPPNTKMTTCQKCIRTGDIENVGKTARHGTFFEMLGNFSFGDYFKEEVIPWAWEFCTEILELPKDRLYVSVYHEDDEAYDIWTKKMGVPEDHMIRLGKKDNFWEIGVGPCGPCSEIYFDRGEKYGTDEENTLGGDGDRFIEFWNLVFTQFDKDEDGNYNKLAKPNIDTGMGLERVATIMQETDSIYDIDTIKSIRDHVCEVANVKYNRDVKKDISIRVITDHLRAMTFMISDGVLPNNEGRGYVLRKLLRRAARHGRLLGIKGAFLFDACLAVIKASKEAYPELKEKEEYIQKVISIEEQRFQETIDSGLHILNEHIEELKKENLFVLSGEKAFKLYDTYGFPLDLTKEILEENEFSVDEESFNKQMEMQRKRARESREENSYMGADVDVIQMLDPKLETKFIGYEQFEIQDVKVLEIIRENELIEKASKGEEIVLILDQTPFYAESGGQIGDKGWITGEFGKIQIKDCKKAVGNKFLHIGIVEEGSISKEEKVKVSIDAKRRMDISRHHSATHLLHKALKEVLGNHVEQAGSYVSEENLRFDFSHFQGMTKEEVQKVEDLVNEKVLEGNEIHICETSIEEAKEKGATALFGEKYGDIVRVVSMGDFSIELCGGSHLKNTAQVGSFKIISESGVAAGVRRIEAVVGTAALSYYKQQNEKLLQIASSLKTNLDGAPKRIEVLLKEMKELNRELDKLKTKLVASNVDQILNLKETIRDIDVLVVEMDEMDVEGLRNIGDILKNKIGSGVVVLGAKNEEKVNFIAMATEDVIKKGIHAGNIIKETAKIAGGGGGGRPNMAQAGGKDTSKVKEALEKAKEVIQNQIQ